MNKRVFIIAGEASGDSHAGALIEKLKSLNPAINVSGIGGKELESRGVNVIYPYREVNFIGFTAVLKNLPAIKKKLNEAVAYVKDFNPNVIILVDFPGFNLKFAEMVRKFYRGKIVYYISPQLWAWHKERVKKIKALVDEMLVVFPFEVDFYAKENIEAKFVGHPLIERIHKFLSTNSKKATSEKNITLLPGSRKEEIKRILPGLLQAAKKLKEEFTARVNIIAPPGLDKSFYDEMISGYDVNLIQDDDNKGIYYKTIFDSDLVFTKAGTPTMECALLGTPFCVVYKAGSINYLIGKNMIKVDYIAMPNILAGKEIVKEFIQSDMNVGNLTEEGKRVLIDKSYTDRMKKEFENIKTSLTDASASETAAKIINSLLR
jgi:lipid-A-disaccharide synthase